MEFMRRIIHILAITIYMLIVLYAVICMPMIFGYHPVVVLSGSMEPIYKVGSVVYYKKVLEEDLKVGDVITFNLNNKTISHRIVDIDNDLIETKGDANKISDVIKIRYKNVLGKVVKVSLPYIGYYIKVINDSLVLVTIVSLVVLVFEFLLSNIEFLNIKSKNI